MRTRQTTLFDKNRKYKPIKIHLPILYTRYQKLIEYYRLRKFNQYDRYEIQTIFLNFIRKNIARPAMRPTNNNNPAKQATGGTSGVYGA